VRIQTENRYKGFWHCVQETYRTEKVRGFYRGVTASALAVSAVSSVSFGTFREALGAVCRLRHGAADARPSAADLSLAGAAAGAARV
ncbi:S2547 protein, partial [Donacobius atricapilla]|nr:S2547 protein [Donacobius atricapilla]